MLGLMKNFFKRYMPTREQLSKNRLLTVLGDSLFKAVLWHPHRRSVQRAVAIGLFWTMPPIPLQMLVASFFCIRFKANLPLALALVWTTNPVTLAPITLVQYHIGAWLLGYSDEKAGMLAEMMADASIFSAIVSIASEVALLVLPVFLGAIFMGSILATIGYFLAAYIWRWRVGRRWQARVQKRLVLSTGS